MHICMIFMCEYIHDMQRWFVAATFINLWPVGYPPSLVLLCMKKNMWRSETNINYNTLNKATNISKARWK